MMRDRLADWPGLAPSPEPGTPEHEQLIRELALATEEVEGGICEETVGALAAVVLRFMLRRGLWPLGTRVEVGVDASVSVTFPRPPRG